VSLLVFVLLMAACALSGSRFRPDAWFRALKKPTWNPPDAVFAPVWALLYVAIAVAGWLVWRDSAGQFTVALVAWAVQLVLNAAWSWLYFGRHQIFAAMIDSAMLFLAIAVFIVFAADINATAAWLFVPYACWVAFATVLNGALWMLNRRPPAPALPTKP